MPWFSQVRQKPLAHWFHTSAISVSKMQTWRSGWYTCHLGQHEMSRSGIFDEEIIHLVRLCLGEAGSSTALIFKFYTLASDSDAICNFFGKRWKYLKYYTLYLIGLPNFPCLSLLIVLLLRELNIFICKGSLLLTWHFLLNCMLDCVISEWTENRSLQGKLRLLILGLFFSFFNIGVYSYKFLFDRCFYCKPYVLVCCVFIFTYLKVFSSFTCKFLILWLFKWIAWFPHIYGLSEVSQVRKQQSELDMEQKNGSKLGKEYVKAVYCHPAYLTYMQSTSWEMPGWMKHKLESKLLGEISITSDTQMTPP